MEYANYKSLFDFINKRIVKNEAFEAEEVATIMYQAL